MRPEWQKAYFTVVDKFEAGVLKPGDLSPVWGKLAEMARVQAEQAAEIATLRAELAGAREALDAANHENGSLKAIVQGWHYLAVGPDEMGDYYTHKQLVKASEPYASPALRKIKDNGHD